MREYRTGEIQTENVLRSGVLCCGVLRRNPCFLFFVFLFVFSVSLYAETFSFKADKMSGSRATGKEVLILSGSAEVHSDSIILKAEHIEIQGADNEFIDCSGNVWGLEEEKNIIFRTDRLRYDRTQKIARLEGDSTLEDRNNEVVVKGRFIEYNDGNETAVFQVAVRLFKESIVCRSEYAVYKRDEQLLDLSGFPVVFKDDDEFRADRIRVDLDTEDVSMEGTVSGSIKGDD
ncbi:MAG: hypothetical protein LBP29_07065 [Treponema sp.]|jgi:lipopolysaccharide export system protein LptA|nr:hypothetical protein [Treponema sp.]